MWDYFISHYIELRFGIAFPLTESAFILGILLIFAPPMKKKTDFLWRAAEFLVLWLVLVMGAGLLETYFIWTIKTYVLMPLLIVVYAIFRSKLSWDLRAVCAVLYCAVFLSSLPMSSTLGRVFDDLMATRTVITAVVQPVMILGIATYIRLCKVGNYTTVPKYCSVLILLISGVHIFAHVMLENSMDIQALVETGFIVIEVAAFHLYYSISKMYDEKIKLQAMYMKREKENYVMEIAHSEIEKLKELRHDMKNHYAFMSYLLEEGKTEELKEYFRQYATELYDVLEFSICGNYTIDYILDFEIKRAKTRGVEIDYKILVPPKLPFDDEDLCSLLTNVLDNAIEAASSLKDKKIELRLEWKNDVLLVHCINATDRFEDGVISSHLPTSKHNREMHGYGMKIIRSVVKKYNGALKIEVRDGKFHLSLFLGQGKTEYVPVESRNEEVCA